MSNFRYLCPILVILICGSGLRAQPDQQKNLPSWNEGNVKTAIISFVTSVTTEGNPDFMPPAERIAVFDNDGTLWCEQPMYFQGLFVMDRIKAAAKDHPNWTEKEPYKSILTNDLSSLAKAGEKDLHEIMAVTHSGMTTEEFNVIVKDWIKSAHHPVFKQPYTKCVYQPMLELLGYLRAHQFKTFIVSGGGVEFMRAFAEETYGVPPEQVIGSSGVVEYKVYDGKPTLVKSAKVEFVDDGSGKPVGINRFIGRRPVMAFGNSDGDLQMLQWTSSGEGPRFCLYVHHTDDKREWAYDRNSHIGRLDKGLDEATAKGWTIVNMKEDWRQVFGFETPANLR